MEQKEQPAEKKYRRGEAGKERKGRTRGREALEWNAADCIVHEARLMRMETETTRRGEQRRRGSVAEGRNLQRW